MSTDPARLDWNGLRIHFVGIGGIGMSALARIALEKGARVSGCDSVESPILAELRRRGCICHVGHSAAHLDTPRQPDMVVHSTAVPLENPELAAAAARGIEVVSRGRMLARLLRGHRTVVVSGAHGKTTTTWIIANMLTRCGADPTVVLGGNVAELGGNSRLGTGDILVAEADESDGSFLHLAPTYPVITNIDLEHLNYYSGLDEIMQAFAKFAQPTAGGAVIACIDCPNVRRVLDDVAGRKITYGTGGGDVAAGNVRLEPGRAVYDAHLPGGTLADVAVSMPGLHNVRNSLAALAVAVELGLPMDAVRAALANTPHIGRRLEKRGSDCGVTIYDDYAHHPAEVRATLEAARMLTTGRLVGVFQPHRYTRTLRLQRQFGTAFDKLDLLLVAPIYAAWEPPIAGVTSELIVRQVKELGRVECEPAHDFESAAERLADELAPGDTLITLGAGNVWQVGDAVLQKMRQTAPGSASDAAQVLGKETR